VSRLRWAIVIAAVVVAALVGLTYHAYASVAIEPGEQSILTVQLNPDWPKSRRLISGVTIQTEAHLHNLSILPLYVPVLEHRLLVGDEYIGDAEPTPSMWLGPRGTGDMPVSAYVPRDSLPALILALVASGGTVDITVESTGTVAGIALTKSKTISFTIVNPAQSA
jgi:hypothetical protein